MKEIKDYLHLYLGCECETPLGVMVLSSIDLHYQYPVWFRYREHDGKKLTYKPQQNYEILSKHRLKGRAFHFSEVKPILRPLSDMTMDEAIKICELKEGVKIGGVEIIDVKKHRIDFVDGTMDNGDGWSELRDKEVLFQYINAEQMRIMLSCGFDLFGLIESGLAIDKTTLTK